MNVYKWHVDFNGSGGLIISSSAANAEKTVRSMYHFNEFNSEHLNVKYFMPLYMYESLTEKGFLILENRGLELKINV